MSSNMNDWVASYLVKENYLLTALEFYQELKENGKQQRLLSKLFKHREYVDEESFARKQRDTEVGLPPNLTFTSGGGNGGDSDENCRLLQKELQKKDEKINVLQYELRIMKADVDKLKQQLSESYQKTQRLVTTQQRQRSNSSAASGVGGVGLSSSTSISTLSDILKNDNTRHGGTASSSMKSPRHSRSLSDAQQIIGVSMSIDNLLQAQESDAIAHGNETEHESNNGDDPLKFNSQPINQHEKQVRVSLIIRLFIDCLSGGVYTITILSSQ